MQPRLMLDTHVLIRWLAQPRKLSKRQATALDEAMQRNEPVAVSAYSLVEIAVLAEAGRLKLRVRNFCEDLREDPKFRILPLTLDAAAESAALDQIKDPADRAIAATARVHRLQLLTSDPRLIGCKLLHVIE